ncbi:MAG TPA: hypothetical protein DCW90_01685 [Lachnospiraceae bacterium]|nr:hypothetical protein [uncultured Lachnoclostridium sp.]HAU84252.1 hypothetical protein [Lachnospiraceae bacterium]
MVTVKLSIQSKEKDIVEFLNYLHQILQHEDFDIDRDLTLIRKRKKNEEQFSTPYTLLDLDYDMFDVVERLKELTIREYSETLIDKDDLNPPMLFVFGKEIQCRQVYIKLKIKGMSTRHVLCVSFHYAKKKMHFPYV